MVDAGGGFLEDDLPAIRRDLRRPIGHHLQRLCDGRRLGGPGGPGQQGDRADQRARCDRQRDQEEDRIRPVAVDEQRLELARGQGATDCWAADERTVERVLEATGGFGADYTFEATGLVAVMRQAVEAARMGWGDGPPRSGGCICR